MNMEELNRVTSMVEDVRRKLPEGPWTNEVDRFEFKYDGYDCLIARAPLTFAWCGYVGVKPGHPAHGQDFIDSEVLQSMNVHGGITYSDECVGHICHQTKEEDKLWWLGFDCGHAFDFLPAFSVIGMDFYTFKTLKLEYRTQQYVIEQTKELATQLKQLEAMSRDCITK